MPNKVVLCAHKNMLGICRKQRLLPALFWESMRVPLQTFLKNQPSEIESGAILANLQLETTMAALLG